MRQLTHDEEEYQLYLARLQRVAEASKTAKVFDWDCDPDGTHWRNEYAEALKELSKSEQ